MSLEILLEIDLLKFIYNAVKCWAEPQRNLDHPAGSLVNSVFFEDIRKFSLGFTVVVYKKIYLET